MCKHTRLYKVLRLEQTAFRLDGSTATKKVFFKEPAAAVISGWNLICICLEFHSYLASFNLKANQP